MKPMSQIANVGATHMPPVCRNPLKTDSECMDAPWRVSRCHHCPTQTKFVQFD